MKNVISSLLITWFYWKKRHGAVMPSGDFSCGRLFYILLCVRVGVKLLHINLLLLSQSAMSCATVIKTNLNLSFTFLFAIHLHSRQNQIKFSALRCGRIWYIENNRMRNVVEIALWMCTEILRVHNTIIQSPRFAKHSNDSHHVY